ncbi:MAG TPA: 5-oxoprolinase subunit PxpB [Candidatus Eremiobacteraceae bacterium]|nr:5-oxoprolinase subunit PxpB [Candidatus Eremiobacteraceae bacterium]
MKFCAASDQAMLVYLGEEIGLGAHERVLKLLHALRKQPPAWLRNLQPAYASLMVTFDPTRVDHGKVESVLREYEQRAQHLRRPKPRTIEIPVCYGGEFGPDLQDVAKLHGLKPAQVIEAHTSRTYHAYFLGFAPGFAYLGDLPDEIATPRLPVPRKQVPVGSVAIAGKQTAVYPLAVPGGWRLIGRTPTAVFRKDRKPMALIAIGDQVKFRAISREEFMRGASL